MTRRVFRLGLEPMAERYTGLWDTWVPAELAQLGDVEVRNLRPYTPFERPASVETGAFLDLHRHARWQAGQLALVAEHFANNAIHDGDVFWCDDIGFPGIEQLRYQSRLSGKRVFVFGYLHAGSYTREDFMAGVADVGQFAELSQIAACDAVFVGSEYHKEALKYRRLGIHGYDLGERVHAVGNFFHRRVTAAPKPYRERGIDVLFPHRPDREKRPLHFLGVARDIVANTTLTIAFTTGRKHYRSSNDQVVADAIRVFAEQNPTRVALLCDLSPGRFYAALEDARVVVSTAVEENFGYAMLEALDAGCSLFMPGGYAYPELLRGPTRADTSLYHGVIGLPRNFERLCALADAHYPNITPQEREDILRRHEGAGARMRAIMLDKIREG